MSNTSQRRLFKDLQKIQSEELPGEYNPPMKWKISNAFFSSLQGINATPIDNDMRVWNALIDGPVDTCYEDGLFTLRMEFSGRRKHHRCCFFSIRYLRFISIDSANCSIYMQNVSSKW